MAIEKATFGAGCFWCVETIFSRIKGVNTVISGYTGGDNEDPTYEQVCSGETNHAEVVELTFDTDVVNFDTLLKVFFAIHDPTTLNRQGDDVGTQYRSVVYYHNEQQQQQTVTTIAALNNSGKFDSAIVTEVSPTTKFYSAESYHQNYFENNQENRYCQLVVAQKVQKFLAEFAHLLKDE